MVVQHNLQAMNSNRMLGITTKTMAGSTEKLSSGYKINRAADNAAEVLLRLLQTQRTVFLLYRQPKVLCRKFRICFKE